MVDTTRTTTALLEGLFDPANELVWLEFDQRYRPIVVAFARKLGLSDADAADVAQETLTQFVKEYGAGKYDRSRSRLRSWLIGIAKYRVAGVYRKRASKREARGQSAIVDMTDEDGLVGVWEAERRAVILREAMTQLRDKTKTDERTITAFEMHVVNQMPVAAVAEELGISVQDVYLAKSRVAARLREILATIENAYDEGR